MCRGRAAQWTVLLTVLLLMDSSDAFFEKQPKILTEFGNLILESALDANINIRLRGSGAFQINGVTLSTLMQSMKNGNATVASVGQDVTKHLSDIDMAVLAIQAHFAGQNSIQARLRRLESRDSRGMSTPTRTRNLMRRVQRLEQQLTEMTARFEADHCASTPCQNGGSCRNELGTFACTCPPNFEGVSCALDRNECAVYAGTDLGCQNGATCENTHGGYMCSCANGWKGVDCTRRTVDCLAGPAGDLCGHGACVQTNNARGYTCVCEQGWRSDGVSLACTVDVNECTEERPHCSMDPPVPCVNLPGSYMCGSCPAGYEGNGYYCRDVDECAVANGGCSTTPSVRCINTRGSHHCAECPSGWQGDGRICTRSSSVLPDGGMPFNPFIGGDNSTCTPGLCHPAAICRPRIFGFTRCECPPGMLGTGYGLRGCRLPNEPSPLGRCARHLCLNGGTCVDSGVNPTCVCPPGYMPPLCMPQNDCASQPCKNGGTCMQVLGLRPSSFMCRCTSSHRGRTCEEEVRQCGGVLSAATGVLQFPLAGGAGGGVAYQHNQRCAWVIQTNVTQVLNVTFTKFSLEQSADCRADWLQIHDGTSSSAHLIGRFCGARLPANGHLVSTHNALYLWFRSDNTSAHDGFELEWTSVPPVCGGLANIGSFGTITSPGSPGNYPQNRDCEWRLVAPVGKRIELHFFAMQLEQNSGCDNDYVAVHDGTSAESDPLLARFCNTTHPEPLTSGANELLIRFHSDSVGTDAGFQIHYSVVEGIPGCGGTWTGTRGEIASPVHDGRYPRNLQCEFVIRMPVDSQMRLTFREFDLEYHENCEFDYVAVYEGATRHGPLVGRFCGRQLPDVYVSQSNVLTVEMKTDWSVTRNGFRLQYEVVCARKYTDASGTFTSPMYPNQYERQIVCTYEIIAPPGKTIVLDFEDFDVEDTDSSCSFDSLSIYDGHVDTSKSGSGQEPLQTLCGTDKPAQVIATTNVLTLILRTDGSIQGRGFKANYTWAESGCGGVIKDLGHVLQPPQDAETNRTYESDANCTWLIVAPRNKIVQLTFSSFDLETSTMCWFDYVRVLEGTSPAGTQIGKYCGTNIPPTERTSGSVMTVQFVSDYSAQGEGFRATYEFLDASNFCGGRLFAPTGDIYSPGWPQYYPRNKNCTWILSAPVGQQIEVNVLDFNLERQYHADCNSDIDYLEFRNGNNGNSSLIGRYCSDSIPKTIRSIANRMYVRFMSDSSISASGFRLQWDSTLTGCGGHFRGVDRGSLTSPNYPSPYEEETICEWRISTSQGSTLQLIFSDLDLEEQGNCHFDAVEIYDGKNSGARLLGRYCGSTIPNTINTTTNEVYVRMTSDISNQGRGFDLRFSTNCNQYISNLHGVLQSPNNPRGYPNNMNCKWTITAPRGNRIQLTFSEFALESYFRSRSPPSDETHFCPFDYLGIDQLNAQGSVVESRRICNNMPSPILSFTDTMVLNFKTDFSGTASGFRLEYTIIGCGELLRSSTGRIQSPNYPSTYSGQSDCSWDIEVPYGNLIELTVHDYDLRLSANCSVQGVAVSHEHNMTAELRARNSTVQKLCGRSVAPVVITSHSNRLYVHLYSEGAYSGRGFNATYRMRPIQCGGLFTGIRGVIKSPNYPNNYDNNLNCEWLIQVDKLHKVQLRFPDFSLERNHYWTDECMHDSVNLYSGNLPVEDQRIANLCGHDANDTNVFHSTGHQMLVVMTTDFSETLKGFQANYWTTCGTAINVTADGGTITSDTVFRYGETIACEWSFRAENPDERIVLTFLEYYNTDETCDTGIYIHANAIDEPSSTVAPTNATAAEVRDTKRRNGWLCQTDVHRTPFVSITNTVGMSVHRTAHTTSDQFRFRVQYALVSSGCGSTFRAKHGQIASPGYPGTYPLSADCEWTIGASVGNRLLLTFGLLDVDESERCNEAYVEVRERDAQGQLLGTFCGTQVPDTLEASSFWVKFHAGDGGTGRGFLASYSHVNLVESTAEIGELQSPLFPDYDVRSINRQYRIIVSLGSVVSVQLQELLNIAGATLTFYDGFDDHSVEIITLSDVPPNSAPPITSTTNVLFVVWSAPTEALFRLTWTAHSPYDLAASAAANSSHLETLNCSANSLVRIGIREKVNLTSPGYPHGYSGNEHCRWTLAAIPDGYHVAIYFDTVDLEDTPNCASDSVSVALSDRLAGPFHTPTTFCTAQSNVSIHSKIHGTPYLQLTFNSDFFLNRTGFAAVAIVQCGGTLTGPSGRIDKNMTLTDMYGTTCDWRIGVGIGRTVRITWRRLRLKREPQSQGCDSHLMLRNGPTHTAPYLGIGQYCGTELPAVTELQSTGPEVTVQFTKGTRNVLDDFALDYEEVSIDCGGTYRLDEPEQSQSRLNRSQAVAPPFHIVQTPNYPNIPHAYTECVWTVIGPHGQTLRVDFEGSFELAVAQPCTQELVELRDGASDGAPVIGTFCDQMPSTQHTASNVLRVRYFTQAKLPKNGFRARVTVDRCGGSYREPEGLIQSAPDSVMGSSQVCDYRIHSRPGATLNITFLDLDTSINWSSNHEDLNCSSLNHVAVYSVLSPAAADGVDGDTAADPGAPPALSLIDSFCDIHQPQGSIITQAGEVVVRLVVRGAVANQRNHFRLYYNTSLDRCGGEINADAGHIQSPGYPVGRSNRQFCEWRITVPKGRRVRVDIEDFDLAATQSTLAAYVIHGYFQRLNFYNDMSYGSRIRTMSGQDAPDTVYSSDNQMLINMWSRSNVGHRGFRLNFTSNERSACGGDLNDPVAGQLTSPINHTSSACRYQRNATQPFFDVAEVSASPGVTSVGTLALDIRTVEAMRTTCSVGLVLPLKVMHGARELFTARRSCANGTETGSAVTVLSPFADTAVVTRQNVWLRDYTVDYRVFRCGGVIAAGSTATNFAVAPVPSDSVVAGQPVYCAWQYTAAPGMRLVVSMTFAQLDCEHEHVAVHNGRYASAPLLERVCGNEAGVRNFTADISGGAVLIEFRTRLYRANVTAFSVHVVTDVAHCGGLLMAPNFKFRSPQQIDGPLYPNNMRCEWELRARRGYHVRLAFRNRFFVEDSANCTKDAVRLDDFLFGSTEPHRLATLCGRTVPAQPFDAAGRGMLVSMQTDERTGGDGFEAEWSEVCGGVYTVREGDAPQDVFSPNYPENYGGNAFCNYTLIGPSDQYVNVEFVDFQLEDSVRGCVYDNLTVYRTPEWGYGTASELVGTYCREGALRHMRYKSSMQLVFRSDQWLERRGFHFRFSLDRCGGEVHESQMVRLPQTAMATNADAINGAYLPELRCVWNITAPEQHKIVVRFERIEVEGNDKCVLDFVDLYEGPLVEPSKRRVQLCGNLTGHAPVVNVQSNRAVLRFHSDASTSAGGMEALVLFVRNCDANIELTERQPTYDLSKVFAEYEANLDCHYKVTGPPGWSVAMEFKEFHVAPCSAATTASDCACDFVQVRDGAGEFAEPIGTNRCGYELPSNVTSTHAALWVRFVTDSQLASTGFRAIFHLERTVCGPSHFTLNETHSQQTLSWPLNGGNYLPNQRCQWLFSVPTNMEMVMTFDRLDVQQSADNGRACSNDYLEVLDNRNQIYLPEGLHSGSIFNGGKAGISDPSFYQNKHYASAAHVYCGRGTPSDYVSDGNELMVRFRSDDSVQLTGFALTVKVLSTCQRNFTSLSGRIASSKLSTCDTHVTVPSNYTIALYFTRFMLYSNDQHFNCSKTNAPLQILDGGALARWDCPGTTPSPFFSNRSSLTLRFTELDVMYFGSMLYDITYVASDQGRGCGGHIYNYGGQISSPLYPQNERQNRDCRWQLMVPQNQVVSVQFDVFDMGPSSTCADNFVQLIEVHELTSVEKTVRTFCGMDTPGIFVSASNRLVVRFKKTVNFAGTGWLMNFMALLPNTKSPQY